MRISSNLTFRLIGDDMIILRNDPSEIDLSKVISVNSTAREIIEHFKDGEFEAGDISRFLVELYGIEQDRADEDTARFIDQMKELEIVEA